MAGEASGRCEFPPNSPIRFAHLGKDAFRLTTSQVLPLPPDQAFGFFEDPRNLFEITPDRLDFRMADRGSVTSVHEGAEFDYTIRWLGSTIPWRSRIADYHPPDRFADVQVRGPYRSWVHLHLFGAVADGTLMQDIVTYEVPCGPAGRLVHRFLIRRRLEDIFRYRAVQIEEWVRRNLRHTSRRPERLPSPP